MYVLLKFVGSINQYATIFSMNRQTAREISISQHPPETSHCEDHTMSQKLYIQMSGAPGSGKTTLSRLLAASLDGTVIEHDLLKSTALDVDRAVGQVGWRAYRLQ